MIPFGTRLAAGFAALALPLAAQAIEYDVRRIDPSAGGFALSTITAINAHGQLAGVTASGQVGILTGNTLVSTALPGTNPDALDLNDQGVLLGRASAGYKFGSYSNIYTFSAQDGLHEIQASKDMNYSAQGYPKISNAGHIVLYGAVNGTPPPGWGGDSGVLSNPDGSYVRLPFRFDGDIVDVNSSGISVGSVQGDAVYWDASGQQHVLGKLGGRRAGLSLITDSGLIVGSRQPLEGADPATPSLFIHSLADGQTRFLDVPFGVTGIDGAGRLYGYSYADGVSTYMAWDNGELTNLSALLDGTPNGGIRSVSSDGRILIGGWGGLTYVLTPTPEPGTYVLMGIGLAAAGWGARRRRGART